MADINYEPQTAENANCFKEAVCIDAGRIYDSCSDKDCLEDLRVYFTDAGQPLIDNAYSVKCRRVEVLNVFLDVEPVPFNRGFYSVDMTYFFLVRLDAYTSPVAAPIQVDGLATFCKKVILYGSEGNVKVFSTEGQSMVDFPEDCGCYKNLPKASVKVAEPIVLATNLCEACNSHCCETTITVPKGISKRFEGDFSCANPKRYVEITLGIFSIVQLERQVQMMIPVYDFCIPDKECITTSDNPCELFKRIKFPVDEFFPPRLSNEEEDTGCGCQ
ncbi:MAG TPA: hypothetical protein H9671_07755 [Firmicutes bacterium]|nr:hypothetical protein [Bacillota bacterium]